MDVERGQWWREHLPAILILGSPAVALARMEPSSRIARVLVPLVPMSMPR